MRGESNYEKLRLSVQLLQNILKTVKDAALDHSQVPSRELLSDPNWANFKQRQARFFLVQTKSSMVMYHDKSKLLKGFSKDRLAEILKKSYLQMSEQTILTPGSVSVRKSAQDDAIMCL